LENIEIRHSSTFSHRVDAFVNFFQPSGPVIGPSIVPPAGPLIQKQITVIQVPSLDKNKDKNNKTGGEANKDQLRVSLVSSQVTVRTVH
jgi:hypothetical protein